MNMYRFLNIKLAFTDFESHSSNVQPPKTDYYTNNLCTQTITGDRASTNVIVLLNWNAELLMDNLAEHENAAAPLQIRSDSFSMYLWSMPVPAYW